MLWRNLDDDCKLKHVMPEEDVDGKFFAKISKAVIHQNVQRWCNTPVGSVLGDRPY